MHAHSVLLQKERLGVHAVIHTTLQMALERGVSEEDVPTLLQEIKVAVDQALEHIANELGIKFATLMTPACEPAPAPAPVPTLQPLPPPPPLPPLPVLAPVKVEVAPVYIPAAAPIDVKVKEPTNGKPVKHPTTSRALPKRITIKRSYRRAVLPDEVLLNIFERLLPLPPPRQQSHVMNTRGRFRALIAASGVCADWRKTALGSAHLWSRLEDLSFGELVAFPELVARSKTSPLDVDLDLRGDGHRKYPNAQLANTVQANMFRIRSLAVRLNPSHTSACMSFQRTIGVSAPLLESLTLSFAPGFTLYPSVFMHRAPKLTRVAMDPDMLPTGSTVPEAFRHVIVFDARMRQHAVPESLARLLFTTCPSLKTLLLSGPLSDAGDIMKAPPPPGMHHPGSFYSGDRNLDHVEILCEGDVVPTLQLFNHKHIAHVHLVSPDVTQVDFVRRRIGDARNLCVGDGRIALRDDRRMERVFSGMRPERLSGVLRVTGLARALESLTVWECIPEEALRVLLMLRLPLVRRLSILVRGYDTAAVVGGISVFQALRRDRWELPELQTLRFTTEDVSGAFVGPPSTTPSLHTRDVLDFVRDGLWYKAHRLREVVFDGVVFVEGWYNPLVNGLRECVDDVYMC